MLNGYICVCIVLIGAYSKENILLTTDQWSVSLTEYLLMHTLIVKE